MTVKVGINGFGRIGRQVLKAIRDYHGKELEVVAFNDIGDLKTMAHLLKYDSNYGRFDGKVEVVGDGLIVDGRKIKAFKETDPSAIPWGSLGVEIVIESTGLFTIKEDGVNKKGKTVKGAANHITKGGAKKVIISAPSEGEDLTHRARRQRRQVRSQDAPRGIECLLHYERAGPGGQGRAMTSSRSSAAS